MGISGKIRKLKFAALYPEESENST